LQQDEGDADLKVLVFTEFVPTQEMLHQFLKDRSFSVACLNNSTDMDERSYQLVLLQSSRLPT
jgi:hypothetical protein